MTTDYRPIGCAGHSALELIVMRREVVRVAYRERDQSRMIEGNPIDVITRQGAEYLAIDPGGCPVEVRLDLLETIHSGNRLVFERQNADSRG
jgi:transcriptional antiterminator Rof (Rho-off)